MLQRESLFSLKVRAFYGDGGRIVKVKMKKANYARGFEVPTKMSISKW